MYGNRLDKQVSRLPSSPSPWGEEFLVILKEHAKLETLRKTPNKQRRYSTQFSVIEDDFFHAAEFGDIPTVERMLRTYPEFNVNKQDLLGRTPLRLAVANEHLEIMEMLLNKTDPTAIYEALLIAIVMGHEQIAEVIIKSGKYAEPKREDWRASWVATENDDSPFSFDVPALTLAAQYNRYEIVQLLLMKGKRIYKPHAYYCTCDTCKEKLECDQLRFRKSRLDTYKGLSSEAYISLASRDPILTAFDLGKELRSVASVEKHFKQEYLHLADKLSDYVVKLLDRVRSNDELETLLNKSNRSYSKKDQDEHYETLARLKLAIENEEKKFVAHPTCQQKLVSIWYGELRPYLEKPKWYIKLFLVTVLIVMYPFLAAVFLVYPYGKIGKSLRTPCVKLIAQTFFFIIFLLLVLASSLTETPSSGKKLSDHNLSFFEYQEIRNSSAAANLQDRYDIVMRANYPELVYIFVILWVAGLFLQECKELYHEGLHKYFSSLYNLMDTVMMACYIGSFILKFYCFNEVSKSQHYFTNSDVKAAWKDFARNETEAINHFYWFGADRLYWNNLDPYILSEALFGFANVFCFSRISSLLPANEYFGPMQISLGKMIKDIAKFMFIFTMVFLAFLVGMINVYWYYLPKTREKVEIPNHNIPTRAETRFGDVITTFRTMFWALFGMGEPEVVQLGDYKKSFTEDVGYILYGSFNFAMVLVLLNMLIAMMTRSFETIHRDSDIEWKFARSQLYMDYIAKGNTLPAPLNIIPPPYYIYRRCKQLYNKIKCCKWKKDMLKDELEMGEPKTEIPTTEADLNGHDNYSYDDTRCHTIREKEPGDSWHAMDSSGNGRNNIDSDRSESCAEMFEGSLQGLRKVSVNSKRYERVIQSIVKRHIFKSEYEDIQSTGVSLEEIKQDISSFRYETLNSMETNCANDPSAFVTHRMENVEKSLDFLQTSMEFMQDKLNMILLHQAKQIGVMSPELEAMISQDAKPRKNPNLVAKSSWKKIRSQVKANRNSIPEPIAEEDETSESNNQQEILQTHQNFQNKDSTFAQNEDRTSSDNHLFDESLLQRRRKQAVLRFDITSDIESEI